MLFYIKHIGFFHSLLVTRMGRRNSNLESAYL